MKIVNLSRRGEGGSSILRNSVLIVICMVVRFREWP